MPRVALCTLAAALSLSAQPRVKQANVTILSTMMADSGIGEWGFAALVEADGRRILFDTGAHPDTVLKNARELKVDLTNVTDVILSHYHGDHTGGLLTLRREYSKANPKSLSTVHVAQGMFWPRPGPGREFNPPREFNPMIAVRTEFEATGGAFLEYTKPTRIGPGIWLTGPVPRQYPERNWSGNRILRKPDGSTAEDNLPDDMSLILDTDRGLVVISGCGHSGIINTLEHARKSIREAPIHAAVGGFHLFEASDATLEWTSQKLKEFSTANFLGAHCTGVEAVYRIRQLVGLDRKTCAVGSVGGGFTLGKGLNPGAISR